MQKQPFESGLSVLGVLFLLLLVFAAVSLILIAIAGLFPGFGYLVEGLVARSVQETGEAVRVTGTPIGYKATFLEIEGIGCLTATENQNAIGFVRVSITPLVGTLAIDTDLMDLAFVTKDSSIPLRKTMAGHVAPGNWTIIRKYNVLPGKNADRDDILEANEVFDILISLPQAFGPHQKASIVFSPEHGMSYSLELSIPPVITPVTFLS